MVLFKGRINTLRANAGKPRKVEAKIAVDKGSFLTAVHVYISSSIVKLTLCEYALKSIAATVPILC